MIGEQKNPSPYKQFNNTDKICEQPWTNCEI